MTFQAFDAIQKHEKNVVFCGGSGAWSELYDIVVSRTALVQDCGDFLPLSTTETATAELFRVLYMVDSVIQAQ